MNKEELTYKYFEDLLNKAKPYVYKIDEEWETLTYDQVEDVYNQLKEIADEARKAYEELSYDDLYLIDILHDLEFAEQDAEELLKDKRATL